MRRNSVEGVMSIPSQPTPRPQKTIMPVAAPSPAANSPGKGHRSSESTSEWGDSSKKKEY